MIEPCVSMDKAGSPTDNQGWWGYPHPVSLQPGHVLFAGPDDQWNLFRPDGTFLRLRASPQHVAALVEILQASEPVRSLLACHPQRVVLAGLLRAFDNAGLLDAEGRGPVGVEGRHVMVCGSGGLAAHVQQLLEDEAITITTEPDPGTPPESCVSEALIACATWLPDLRWQALDAWSVEHGTPWHMAYWEGSRFFVGPMAIPGRTATYRDVRDRRLAAAAAPDQLRALWHHLDREPPPSPAPEPWHAAMTASILVADVLAFLRGATLPAEGHQVEIEASTLSLIRHPVLPLSPELRDGPSP